MENFSPMDIMYYSNIYNREESRK